MSGKQVIITTKKGKVSLDIPGHEPTCEKELDHVIEQMSSFVPEERINRTPPEKDEVEVNVT